jgi:hypothetical protein
MNEVEAVGVLRHLFKRSSLNDVDEAVFSLSWQGLSYPQMAERLGYDHGYIRGVGCQLWQALSKVCGQRVTKKNIKSVFKHQLKALPLPPPADSPEQAGGLARLPVQDWGDAPDHHGLYGREAEQEILHHWIVADHSRLVGVFGLGGLGKTAIAAHSARQLQGHFDYVLWRCLHHAPPLSQLLADVIQFLPDQQGGKTTFILDQGERIDLLIRQLKHHRCLLVFDNAEAILQSGTHCGRYCPGYEPYGELFRQVGEQDHQSCLVVTSREKPLEFSQFEGACLPVRSLQLMGLQPKAGQAMVELKGFFLGRTEHWQQLVDRYCGNPLALKIAAAAILDMFDGEVASFLDHGVFLFDDINELLDTQFNRLSGLEQEIMYRLAIEREPVSVETLEQTIRPARAKRHIFEALKSLLRRSLVHKSLVHKQTANFTQQPMMRDYLLEKLGQQADQIELGYIPPPGVGGLSLRSPG